MTGISSKGEKALPTTMFSAAQGWTNRLVQYRLGDLDGLFGRGDTSTGGESPPTDTLIPPELQA